MTTESPTDDASPTPSRKRSWLSRLGPTGLLALLWTASPAIIGTLLLVYVGPVSDWLLAKPTTGLTIYVTVFIVAAGCGLLPTYAQAIVGGWVFGLSAGLPAALAGFTGAALLGYAIARSVSQDRVLQTIDENAKARAIRDSLIGHGPVRTFFIVALLRLPPNSPFALTNLVMAATRVPIVPFVLGTVIGMFPRTAIAVGFAASASASARDIQEFIKEGPGMMVFIIGLVVMFIVLGVIGVIANHAIERVEAARNNGGSSMNGSKSPTDEN